MTLIKSISGIRGTIGGQPTENLTPRDAVDFASAYAQWLKNQSGKAHPVVVLGRDARPSGPMVAGAVVSALTGMGVDVIDLGLSTTPSVEMAVKGLQADGGIILTASHNPREWNALKLLNDKGEFISAEAGKKILEMVEKGDFEYVPVEALGNIQAYEGGYIDEHIREILSYPLVDAAAVRQRGFKVVVDAVRSTGGMAVPRLLEALGVEYVCLYCEPNGQFPHNPEPLEKNLTDILRAVPALNADLGVVTDPDVDRLALVDEKGRMFGEEYTLVTVADYVWQHRQGPAVSNLSSSRALRDLAGRYGQPYYASAVGEVNVVRKMKDTGAVIGGEGNGGIIVPDLHYGRDALAGIALVLTYLAKSGKTLSELKQTYPVYHMAKEKIRLDPGIDVEGILEKFEKLHPQAAVNKEDGLKLDYPGYWIHLRRSNTEPIIRIYTEAASPEKAAEIARQTIQQIKKLF